MGRQWDWPKNLCLILLEVLRASINEILADVGGLAKMPTTTPVKYDTDSSW